MSTGSGIAKLEWVKEHMPVVARLVQDLAASGELKGRRIGFSSHLEAKVARTIEALRDCGAQVLVVASNPATTQPDVLEYVRSLDNVQVFSELGEAGAQRRANIRAALEAGPEVCIDDGATLSAEMPDAGLTNGCGVCEQTTSGLLALRRRPIGFPVYAVNDTIMKSLFDNEHGTGESTLSNLLSMGNIALAGKTLAVIGYGRCGAGIANKAQALGARVLVVEVEPRRALAAHLRGMTVLPLNTALAQADISITATGEPNAIPEASLGAVRDGAMLANVGHFADEIATGPLLRQAQEQPYRGISRCRMSDGRTLYLLSAGEAVNLAGDLAMGHPVEIIDVTMGLLFAGAADLLRHRDQLAGGVHDLPDRVDLKIAQLKLEALGIRVQERPEPIEI
ncbi:MAG: adenosylhomocysteinase [Pseudomonadota bacterium]